MRVLLAIFVVSFLCFSCIVTDAQDTNINRAELANEVMNTYEYITQEFILPTIEQPIFLDISQTQYAIRIEQAYVMGFVSGVGENLFLPNKEANISEAIVVFYRLISSLDKESTAQFKNNNLINANVPSWSKIAFEYMNEKRIYVIIDNEEFDAMQKCTYDDLILIAGKIKDLYAIDNEINTRTTFEQFIQKFKQGH